MKISRQAGETWEKSVRENPEFNRLPKAEKKRVLAWAKDEDKREMEVQVSGESLETKYQEIPGLTPHQSTVEKIKADAMRWPIEKRENPASLALLPVEKLVTLEEWMIPPSRKQEVEAYKARERRLKIKEADALARTARGTKPGERMRDPRGYWKPSGAISRDDSNKIRRSREQSAGRAPSSDESNQARREELHSLLLERLARLQREKELLERQHQNAASTPKNKSIPRRAEIAYIKEIGYLTLEQLGDLILSDGFEGLEEGRRNAIVTEFMKLEEAAAERDWQEMQKAEEASS